MPSHLKRIGKTIINKPGALTVQRQPLSAKVRVKQSRGDTKACYRVIRGGQRAVTLKSRGSCTLKVRVIYTAPGTDEYLPFHEAAVYRIKRVR